MSQHRDFDIWMSTFKNTISNYSYWTDFEKVYNNVEKIKVELNILNSLIGSKNIKRDFIKLVDKYPEVLKCIPILLATRLSEIEVIDDHGEYNYKFDQINQTKEQYCYFMEKTGLFKLLSSKKIINLIDYVTGIEVGLDTNARKNRGGHLMEDLIFEFLKNSNNKNIEKIHKEMYIRDILKIYNIDLLKLNEGSRVEKRFDFVVKTKSKLFCIETNFYRSSGSKLNETARSYKALYENIEKIEGVDFVWFTDGRGWKSAKNNLRETFETVPHIYNLNDIKNGIIEEVFK